MTKDKPQVQGQQGFKDNKVPNKDDIITKEEMMFKVGEDGVAIAEKYPIQIYDHNIDRELIEESVNLMQAVKKQEAIKKVLEDFKNQQDKDIKKLKEEIKKETDEEKKKVKQRRLENMEKTKALEEIKEKINAETLSKELAESRRIIQELEKMKKEQVQTRHVEIIPCNTSESYLTFEKKKTVEGKDTDDWVADLISKKCKNPSFTFEEAKNLKPDYKIALKKGIMESSGYNVESYRDIITKIHMKEKKPLSTKKLKPTGENITPAESAS